MYSLLDHLLQGTALKKYKKLSYRRETRATLSMSWNVGLLLYE